MKKGTEVLAFVVRWKKFYPLVRFLGALAIAFVLHRFPMHYLEGALYDGRMRYSPAPSVSGNIVTVAIDAKTLSALEGEPDTRDNIKLIQQIQPENPEAVMYM